MSRLVMVRHAQASLGGREYDRLSALGEEQAQRLGRYWAEHQMVFDRIFVGPRKRHQHTAEIVGAAMLERGLPWPESVSLPEIDEYAGLEVFRLGLPQLAARDAALRERAERCHQNGPHSTLELLQLFQHVIALWVRGELSVPGVETWKEFRLRARRGLELLQQGGAGGKQIAVFTSTGPVAAAMDLAFNLDDERLMEVSYQVRNTAVTEFLFDGTRFSLSMFNALPHLPTGQLITHI